MQANDEILLRLIFLNFDRDRLLYVLFDLWTSSFCHAVSIQCIFNSIRVNRLYFQSPFDALRILLPKQLQLDLPLVLVLNHVLLVKKVALMKLFEVLEDVRH